MEWFQINVFRPLLFLLALPNVSYAKWGEVRKTTHATRYSG